MRAWILKRPRKYTVIIKAEPNWALLARINDLALPYLTNLFRRRRQSTRKEKEVQKKRKEEKAVNQGED